ncbi:MAG: PBP1A family penicillin-binding protein [Treponema sp.]|nr:PBP1A family penicillin-binding protein [Treponema sp.]
MTKIKGTTIALALILFIGAIVMGASLGAGIAATINIKNNEEFTEFSTALPTKLLDINGELITEFASDEKREIISLGQLPQHMIDALITREDRIFYKHHGFSVKALVRAVVGKLLHMSLGGGSTLTQQIAGTIYCDRSDYSIKRKLKELWWAIQMERRYSKNEILELYLNKIYFGGGTYGVNAASKYYFGHSAEEITPAEAAILVIQLSNPAFYNPFDHPNRARERQQTVLMSMVNEGYLTQEQAEDSFDAYWRNFDYSRTSASAYFMRDDKAPWFSEYVRREFSAMLYGSDDLYTGGFTVNTTLNLSHQYAAQQIMDKYIANANNIYREDTARREKSDIKTYVPMSELLALVFNLPGLKVSEQRNAYQANKDYIEVINPILDISSMLFGLDNLKLGIVNRANAVSKQSKEKTTIEGTMISLENNTGYITAMVGGSKFDQDNQLIRAIQAKVQPGSSFKPLYYSAAIDSRNFTAASVISDTPIVFHTADGKPYIPQNFRGEWMGNVQLWYALAHSMNVPSLKILDSIGFDAAINRAVKLLGISQEELPSRAFVPGYPIGLGVCSVRPVEIARAYAVFANSGKEVTPMAIRTVEDRNGNIAFNPERTIREKQQAKGSDIQVISPQTAFVMTKLLENTVKSGTLAYGASRASINWRLQGSKFTYTDENGHSFTMPAAGKTGTTQNWADAWAVGYSPYYTAAFWFGFDKPGQSLGTRLTGSTLSGVAWGDYFQAIHQGLPMKNFPKPVSGVTSVTVCSDSGQLLTPECEDHQVTLWFLDGTQPTTTCTYHSNSSMRNIAIGRLQKAMYQSGATTLQPTTDTKPLTIDWNAIRQAGIEEEENDEEDDDTYSRPTYSRSSRRAYIFDDIDEDTVENTVPPDYNYLLD